MMTHRIGWSLLLVVFGLAGCGTDGSEAKDDPSEELALSAYELLRSEPRDGGKKPRSGRETLTRSALRLADLQADSLEDNAHNGAPDPDPEDGGWDFDLTVGQTGHSPLASPENTYGVTGLGIWAALREGPPRPRLFSALIDAWLGMGRNVRVDSPPDFVYLVLVSELFENPELSALARRRYDARLAAEGDANAWAQRVRERRHASRLDGLIPYDISWLMLGAKALDSAFPDAGYGVDAQVYGGIVVSDLRSTTPYFDITDTHEGFYVHGLAWSLVALSSSGRNSALIRRVRSRLLAEQAPSGGFSFNADFPEANLQATAHAVQALMLSGPGGTRSLDAARRGARWLRLQQQPNGGWQSAPGPENTLLNAEIALAVFLSRSAGGEHQILPEGEVGRVTAPLISPAAALAPPLSFPLDL